MTRSSAIVLLAFLFAVFSSVAPAQEQSLWDVKALKEIIPGAPAGSVDMDFAGGMAYGTNVFVQYNTQCDPHCGQREG